MKTLLYAIAGLTLTGVGAHAEDSSAGLLQSCGIPSATVNAIQNKLGIVVNYSDGNGGIFQPNLMWSAIVDRQASCVR